MAHALAERSAIERYILSEIERATRFEEPYSEPCGWRGNYVRINLKAVKDGKISVTELAEAFINSTNTPQGANMENWVREWHSIEQVVKELYPDIEGFEQDSTAIEQMFAQDRYVVHHSDIYNQKYEPHYRIVSREEYNKLKDKLK